MSKYGYIFNFVTTVAISIYVWGSIFLQVYPQSREIVSKVNSKIAPFDDPWVEADDRDQEPVAINNYAR